jgi:hypothetical protein
MLSAPRGPNKLVAATFALAALLLLSSLASPARAADPFGSALDWRPGPPRWTEPLTLLELGQDGRAIFRVRGARLEGFSLTAARSPTPLTLPRAAWTSVHLSPPTDGEVERVVLVARGKGEAPSRLVLIHLRTGRVMGDWTDRVMVPLGEGHAGDSARAPPVETTVHWAPDGRRFVAVGWTLGVPALPGELPIRWVESTLGSVVSRIDVPDLGSFGGVTRAVVLGDGRTLVLGTPSRLVVLGPGPIDARTIAPPSHSELIGLVNEGLVVHRRDRLLLIDPQSKSRADVLAEFVWDGGDDGGGGDGRSGGLSRRASFVPSGRFGLVAPADPNDKRLLLIDFQKKTVRPFETLKLRPLLGTNRVVLLGDKRLGYIDLLRPVD